MSGDLDDLRSLTTKQVHDLTGINRKTLDTWRQQEKQRGLEPGELGPVWFKVRGVVLYPLPALREWLADRRRDSAVAS